MICVLLAILERTWCWICNTFITWQDSNVFMLLVAIIVSILLMSNVHAGFMLCEHRGNIGVDGTGNGNIYSTADRNFDYGPRLGPHTWNAPVHNQSPINIDTKCLQQICIDYPLNWCYYDQLPSGVRLQNNGHTLLIHAAFDDDRVSIPNLSGGDLLGVFEFREIAFRWSRFNTVGSEHTIDNVHYPLEMQCLHTNDNNNNSGTGGIASSRSLLMISYMFEISHENPYLDVIVQHLSSVEQCGQSAEVPPFPLSYLMPAFSSGFYSYQGSLTEPPCHGGAEWFISTMPLTISQRQLNEFRQLRGPTGQRINRNARPVQDLNGREVYSNYFVGLPEHQQSDC